MISILRTHSQTLMIFVAAIVILSFITFYNEGCQPETSKGLQVIEVAGKRVNIDEYRRFGRLHQLAVDMGLTDLTENLVMGPSGDPESEFVFNLLTLRHAADAIGLEPTPDQIREAQLALPVFQNDQGQFDPSRLGALIADFVTPRGFTERQIDELVVDLLKYRMLSKLVSATVPVSPAESDAAISRRETKHSVSLVRFDVEMIRREMQPTADEISKFYETEKKKLLSDEQFQVKVATLTLAPDQAKLEGPERIKTLQALANKAYEFSQAAQQPDADFDKLAKDGGYALATTGTFTASDPDPLLEKVPEAQSALASLSPESPISEVLQGDTSFHVLRLLNHLPSRELSLDEAKPKIIEELAMKAAREKIQKDAEVAKIKLEEVLRAGKTFDAAAKELALTAETVPPFSLAEPPMSNPDLRSIFEPAVTLPVGAVSPVVRTETGGLLVCVTKREAPSAETIRSRSAEYASRLSKRRQEMAFAEWLRSQRDAIGAKFLIARQAEPKPQS